MGSYDAEIRVSTKVETSQMQRLQLQIDKAVRNVDTLTKKYDELKNKKIPTEEYSILEGKISSAKQEMESLAEIQKQLSERGIGEGIDRDIAKVYGNIQALKNELSQAVDSRDQDTYLALEDKLNRHKAALEQMLAQSKHSLRDIVSFEVNDREMEDVKTKVVAINAEMQKLEDAGKAFTIGGNREEIAEATNELSRANAELRMLLTKQDELNTRSDKTSGGMKKTSDGLKKIGEAAKKVFRAMHGHVKKTDGMLGRFSSRLKGIALSLLIFNWITKAFNSMVTGMKEGFKNLVRYSDEYNKSVSALKSGNTQLKNSFATAFMPIVQMAIPYIIQLISYVTSVTNAIAQFTAVLAGKSSWIKAVAIQEDYAASLEGTASAAKKASGALASFDSLEVINKTDDSGGSGSGTRPEDMFEEVPIQQNIKDFAASIKDMIAGEDWYGIGALAAEKLNAAFDDNSVAYEIGRKIAGWMNIGIETALGFVEQFDFTQLGAYTGSALQGWIDGFDWAGAGNLLGKSLQGLLDIARGFLDTYKWGSFSGSLAKLVNNFIKNVKWKDVGKIFGDCLVLALEEAEVFLEEVEWDAVGESIVDSLAGIDWLDLLTEVFEAGSAFDGALMDLIFGAAGRLGEHIHDGILETINDPQKIQELAQAFFDYLYYSPFTKFLTMPFVLTYQLGKNIIDGIIQGIRDGDIWSGVRQGFENFVRDIKDYFGIHSPSTLMAEIGTYLIQGMIQGIEEVWDGLIAFFSIDQWLEIAQGMMDGISQKWEESVEWWISAVGDWWDDNVAPWFTAEKWLTLGEGMKKGIYNGFVGIVSKVVDIVNGIISVCESMINYMIEKINDLIQTIVDVANSVPNINISIGSIPGVQFGRVKMPEIPALANGAVLRGGNPFLAILGDQPMGQTNIEAPQSAIEDAVAAGMGRAGAYGGSIEINLNYDGETFARLSLKDILSEMDRQGYDVDILGGLT